jgi:stage III sporulation protein SpoIIIAA
MNPSSPPHAPAQPATSSRDDLPPLLAVLSPPLRRALDGQPLNDLVEVILDLGRRPQACFPGRCIPLSDTAVTAADLQAVIAQIGEFNADNRAGLEGTLHRISAIRNRANRIIGLTMRIGRAVSGTIDLIRDLVEARANTLLLGRPGIGKTTRLREIARILADDLGRRVVIVDTSNEIAGDGDIPHSAIGGARRMQVPHPELQHAVMIEAVENHMPEVIVIDEIGTTAEALAARTIAERGVQLIGTAHGDTLHNLVLNPTLSDLVGGIQSVILGDEEARLRDSQKTVRERKAPPTFDAVVELIDRHQVIVHHDTAQAVDLLLQGLDPGGVRRTDRGEIVPAAFPSQQLDIRAAATLAVTAGASQVRVYPYAMSRDIVERVIRSHRLDTRTVARPEQADLIIALRARAEDARLRRITQATGLPLYVVRKNSTAQIRRVLQNILNVAPGSGDGEITEAVKEAEQAIRRVLDEGVAVALTPRTAALRRMQHRLVTRHRLVAESHGSEPLRHLVIHPA